jgi:hypothetical protein
VPRAPVKYLLRFPTGPLTQNMDREPRRAMPLWYWGLTIGLFLFGVSGAASIGAPLLVLGFFLVLRGIAGRPRRNFWPPLVGVILFFAAFWGVGYLFGPVSCSTISSGSIEIAPGDAEPTIIDNTRTTCDSPFLPKVIEGEAPSLWPVIWSAVAIGLGGAFLTRLALARGCHTKCELTGGPDSDSLGKSEQRNRGAGFLYWLVTGVFIVFGFLAIFSVGLPLLVLGLAMAALSDIRDRPATFWPPLVGIALFFVAYILVAPLTCSQTPVPVTVGSPSDVEPQMNPMTCTRIVLPDYSGVSEPALWPSVVAALAVGGLGVLTTRHLVMKGATRSVPGGS